VSGREGKQQGVHFLKGEQRMGKQIKGEINWTNKEKVNKRDDILREGRDIQRVGYKEEPIKRWEACNGGEISPFR